MCPSRSVAHTNQRGDETVLRRDLFSELLHKTRVRYSRTHCLLHFSIGLPIRGEKNRKYHAAKSKSPNKSRNSSHTTQIPHAASVTSEVRTARLLPAPAAFLDSRGIKNENVAPGPLFRVAHSRP